MNKWKIVGPVVLTVVYFACFIVVFQRHTHQRDQQETVVRVAHRFLHAGIRTAFQEIAAAYEASHPGTRIKYIEVPQNMWVSWITTQLLGDDPPELINSGHLTDEQTIRHLEPLGTYLRNLNPYNAGTKLESVIWRDTFVNGLNDTFNYHERLQEYYSVSTSFVTRRFYYNKDLFREILGTDTPPDSYEQLIKYCSLIKEVGNERFERSIPIASSALHSQWLFQQIGQHFTQGVAREIDVMGTLRSTQMDAMLALLEGKIDLGKGAFRESWLVFRELAEYFQNGFLSVDRDQATFLFLQGRASMLFSASWDAQHIVEQAPFEVGFFVLPFPSISERTGESLNQVTEADIALGGSFSLVRSSVSMDAGLDFLKFLTSQEQNKVFAKHSLRLPSIRGVQPATVVSDFAPVLEGAVPGYFLDLQGFGGGFSDLIIKRNLYRLVSNSPNEVEEFLDILSGKFPSAAKKDLTRQGMRQGAALIQQEIRKVARARRMQDSEDGFELEATRERTSAQNILFLRIQKEVN